MTGLAMIERDLTSADRVWLSSGGVAAASFDCPVGHERFPGGGPMSCHYLVFPRTSTEIVRGDGIRTVATPNLVMLYNPDDCYSRRAISREGDRCDYLAFDGDDGFRSASAPLAAADCARQRRLFGRLRRGDRVEPLEFDVNVHELIAAVVDRVRPQASTAPAGNERASRRQREAIEQAKALLADAGSEQRPLAGIARDVGLAPSSLVRWFRRLTGYSVHQYQLQLRLRRSLELLPAHRGDVAAVACELGFSHQSHFGWHFRRTFGTSPAAYAHEAARPRSGFR